MDIEAYYARIYRYIYYRVHDRSIAEDLTQETFLRFLGSSGNEPERYLYTIARNLCIDEYRRIKPVPLDAEEVPDLPDNSADSLVKSLEVRQALENLSEEDRELLILRYANDEPIKEISKLTGISRFAVYRRLKEAKSRLERALGKETL